jgi:hypothetical protein
LLGRLPERIFDLGFGDYAMHFPFIGMIRGLYSQCSAHRFALNQHIAHGGCKSFGPESRPQTNSPWAGL